MIRYFFSCTRLLMIVFSVCSLFICTLMVRLSFWWTVPPVLRFVFLSLCKVSMNSQPWLLLACCFSLFLLASCFGLCFVWTVLLFMSWLYASTCKLSTLFSDYFYFSSVFSVYYDIFRQLRDNLQIMVIKKWSREYIYLLSRPKDSPNFLVFHFYDNYSLATTKMS